MSVVKRIIKDSIEYVAVDELLADEYDQAGYGGITLTKTPLGTQINLYAMRPGRVIGKRGRAIKEASARLEDELGIANPQITVVEVEIPELNPQIMAARIANALERGVHYRRSLFWSLNRTMEAGALGCEILIKGPLRSNRGRFEKVSEGYIPKSGDPALTYVRKATVHVKMKKGTFGVNVSIVPPDAKFPDKINLDYLPTIEYPEEEEVPLPAGVEPDVPEPVTDAPAPETVTPEPEAQPAVESETQEVKSEPVAEPETKEVKPETATTSADEPIVEPGVKPVEEPEIQEAKPEPKVEVEPEVSEPESPKKEPEPVVQIDKPEEKAETEVKKVESDTPEEPETLEESEEEK